MNFVRPTTTHVLGGTIKVKSLNPMYDGIDIEESYDGKPENDPVNMSLVAKFFAQDITNAGTQVAYPAIVFANADDKVITIWYYVPGNDEQRNCDHNWLLNNFVATNPL